MVRQPREMTDGEVEGKLSIGIDVSVKQQLLRLRDTLSKDCNSLVQRMQKALTEMNIQIHRVISDITGVTGMSILRAILNALKARHQPHGAKQVAEGKGHLRLAV
jgi:transposase